MSRIYNTANPTEEGDKVLDKMNSELRRDGEVGIRGRLKICFQKWIVGSSPTPGTKKRVLTGSFFV